MEPEVYQETYQLQYSYWWFIGQQFLIRNLIKRFLVNKHRAKILDLGCGAGANLQLLNEFGWRIGLDYSDIALHFCRRGLHNLLCQGSISNLPFKDNTFDLITVLDVLDDRNVKDDKRGLKEVYRVLRLNGLAIFREPAFRILMRKHDIVEHTCRRYTIKDFEIKIEEASFKIKDIFYANNFLFPIVLMLKLKEKFFERKEKIDSDLKALPSFLNNALILLSKIEILFSRVIKIPFGVSLICVAVKC